MTSEVAICNQAISWLGGTLITSLDDESKEAELCKANYAPLRDAVLEAHDWTFATTRHQIPKMAAAPAFQYANAFAVPGGVLRVREVNKQVADDPTRDWQIEVVADVNAVVTNDNSCNMRATSTIEDPNRFSKLFIQALAQRIAADIAIPLTQSRTLQEQHFALYQNKVMEAANKDGLQGKSRRARARWLQNARLSSGPRTAGPYV